MGTSTSARQLGRKFDRLAAELKVPTRALNATGLAGKGIFLRHGTAAGVIGSRVADKRKAIGARYDINKGSGTHGSVIVTYTGPAHLVNNPTRAHQILPRMRPGIRRRRGSRALNVNGNPRASANHPGTSGKGFFQTAKVEAARTLPQVYGRVQLTEPLKEIFR